MKRCLTYLLAVIMVLLSGCMVQPGTEPTESSLDTTLQGTENQGGGIGPTAHTAETSPQQSGNQEPTTNPTPTILATLPQQDETVPEFVYTDYPDPMLDIPKGQDYYFLCPEYDLRYNLSDYSRRGIDRIMIPIISRQPIDPKQIEVVLPLEYIRYEVWVSQATPDKKLEYYLYKCYEDWDWAAEAKAQKLSEKKKTDVLTQEEQALLEDYYKRNQEIMDRHTLLLPSKLPGSLSAFYCYTVLINFRYSADTMQEETVSYMDVSWPGVSFRQDCGTIRFYYGEKTDYGTSAGGAYKRVFAGGAGGAGAPYGLAHGSISYVFIAQKDMVLEKVTFLNKQTQLKQVFVIMKSKNGNINFRWDGQTPIPVNAGAEVQLRIVFIDSRLASLVTAGRVTARLDYSCGSGQGAWVEDLDLERFTNWYELAAVYFDGVDVPGYYREYYNPIFGPKYYQ